MYLSRGQVSVEGQRLQNCTSQDDSKKSYKNKELLSEDFNENYTITGCCRINLQGYMGK